MFKVKDNGKKLYIPAFGMPYMPELESFDKKKLGFTDELALRYAAEKILSIPDTKNFFIDECLYINNLAGCAFHNRSIKHMCMDVNNRIVVCVESEDENMEYYLVS